MVDKKSEANVLLLEFQIITYFCFKPHGKLFIFVDNVVYKKVIENLAYMRIQE
jgi:hypothetical protein